MTDTSLDHLPSLLERNRLEGTVNFFSPWKTSEEISCLTILSSAEAAGGFLSDLLYADTESIYNATGKKSVPRLTLPAARRRYPRNSADGKRQQGTLLGEAWARQSKKCFRRHLNKEG